MTSNQLERKGFFQSLYYPLIKNFTDQFGIEINGNRRGDIQIKNERFYYRLLKFVIGIDQLAFGESYVDDDWDTDDLIYFLEKVVSKPLQLNNTFKYILKFMNILPFSYLRMQTKDQSKKNISAHYDIGNDLFKLMLDRTMNYSCAYWQKNVLLDPLSANDKSELKITKNTLCKTLEEAQLNKMLLISKKLNLKPGMKILDIGCGWGYLAKFLAINFDVHVIGITISEEQFKYATSIDLELTDLEFLFISKNESGNYGKFEFRLIDYRDVDETFDRIVSVGMFEHVGKKNYDEFFTIVKNCLKDDGLFLLHTIGIAHLKIPQVDKFVNKYIFPGGMIPYHTQIIDATQGKFLIEDWHNFGVDYYRTLCVWRDNFEENWPKLKDKYDERFKRIWTFYLCASASTFKARKLNLFQCVFSKRGLTDGYVSYR